MKVEVVAEAFLFNVMVRCLRTAVRKELPVDRRIFAMFFESRQQYWGRHGFDSGYVVRVSMQSGGERLLKTISKP